MSTALRACALRPSLSLAVGLTALGAVGRHRVGAEALRLCHPAARHAQLHDCLGRRQGAEGKGGHEHAGAANRRRHRASIPMVDRGEAELGIANMIEVADGAKAGQTGFAHHRSLHACAAPFWVRKDSAMKTIADLKGKNVALGYSAMRTSTKVDGAPRDRRSDGEGCQRRCLCQMWFAAPMISLRGRPTCSSSPSARRRCARSMPPSAASARSRSPTSGMPAAQEDHALRLSDAGSARTVLRRRRESDEGLQPGTT